LIEKNNFSIEDIKDMTISELIALITSNVSSSSSKDKQEDDIVYNSKQLLEKYPMFTKYTLDIAIKKENLPFFRIGHLRYFKKSAVDNWIKENNKPLITVRVKDKNNGSKGR